ncbi:MAG: glycosyltransferase family 2 protein [Algisphaera sp.]
MAPQTFTTDLIIPAYNEAENLPALAAALAPLQTSKTIRRVILVNNGSTDTTAQLAREAGFDVVDEPQRGYGNACLAGLAFAANNPPSAIGFFDADLADDPNQLPTLIKPLANDTADLVLGQRRALAQKGALEPHQAFGNWLACTLLRMSTGHRYRDLGPMRVIHWQHLQTLNMVDRTWGWTVEMQYKAARQGLRIQQIDVPYRKRHAGKSKISGSLIGSARAGIKIIAVLTKLWWKRD